MKNLLILFLTCAAVLGQTRPLGYDNTTRDTTPTNIDYLARALNISGLTASTPLELDASKNVVSGTQTGTGAFVRQTSPTLTTPTIASFANATHDHSNAASGGVLTPTAVGLTDPGADRILFWDDSAGVFAWLTAGSGLTITTTTMTASGGGGGTAGTVINTGTPVQYNLPYYLDTTGTNIGPSSLSTDSTLTNFYAGGFFINTLTVTNPIPVTSGGLGIASGTSGGIPYFSASTTIASSAALTANAVVVGGGAGAAPSASAVSITAGVVTGAQYDASGTGNVLKQTKQLILQRPDYGDGIGAVPQTNAFNVSGLMHYTFSGNAETNANYVVYEFDCPSDLDTTVAMTARFAFISGGTDADNYVFHLTYDQVAAGTAYPTGTGVDLLPIVMTVTPTTAANGDLQESSAVTLTGWAAALTAGRPMQVRIARLQNTQDDSARDVQLVITYGSTL